MRILREVPLVRCYQVLHEAGCNGDGLTAVWAVRDVGENLLHVTHARQPLKSPPHELPASAEREVIAPIDLG